MCSRRRCRWSGSAACANSWITHSAGSVGGALNENDANSESARWAGHNNVVVMTCVGEEPQSRLTRVTVTESISCRLQNMKQFQKDVGNDEPQGEGGALSEPRSKRHRWGKDWR